MQCYRESSNGSNEHCQCAPEGDSQTTNNDITYFRHVSEKIEKLATTQIMKFSGAIHEATRGIDAPSVNIAAEVIAAWMGLAPD